MSKTDEQTGALYAGADSPKPFPLLVDDPPKIGDFWLDARLTASPSGVVYFAHADDKPSVLLLHLSQGAANDAAARDRLAGEVNKLHADTVIARGGQGQDSGRLAGKFRSELDDPITPGTKPVAGWVALAYDGKPHAVAEANRLLRTIDLSATTPLGSPSGPRFELPWVGDSRIGSWRAWPLPWPGRHDRAGILPLLASWLLTIMLAGLGLLIAVLIFQNSPPESPTPPVPTNQQSSSSNSSSSPQESQSASSDSSQSQSQSQSPSSGESSSPTESSQSSAGESSSSASQSPSYDSPSKEPSMGSAGTGDHSGVHPPTGRNTKL
uniref:hypothetical protein n=1 Tax=Vaginimicrobium propionicum TaxID=1871034 RepID=UPI000970E1C8|nr:hypothetical protein [Vaginimicrobium propionicum]